MGSQEEFFGNLCTIDETIHDFAKEYLLGLSTEFGKILILFTIACSWDMQQCSAHKKCFVGCVKH